MTHNFHPFNAIETPLGKPQMRRSEKLNFQLFSIPAATEIRCQEKSRGGLRYEVILAEPNLTQVQIPKAAQQNAAPKPLTAEEIAEKLRAAEERRLVSTLDLSIT